MYTCMCPLTYMALSLKGSAYPGSFKQEKNRKERGKLNTVIFCEIPEVADVWPLLWWPSLLLFKDNVGCKVSACLLIGPTATIYVLHPLSLRWCKLPLAPTSKLRCPVEIRFGHCWRVPISRWTVLQVMALLRFKSARFRPCSRFKELNVWLL